MPDYSDGATWESIGKRGSIGRVWLASGGENPVWRWSFELKDGSGRCGDWTPSRRTCVEECSVKFGAEERTMFKRVA